MTGEMADISFLAEFGWFQWVWFVTPQGGDSLETRRLGRYCGPSFEIGDALCARILTDKAQYVHRTSVFPLSVEDENSEAVALKKQAYTESLKKVLGKHYVIAKEDDKAWNDTPEAVPYVPIDDQDPEPLPPLEEADEMTDEAFDKYILARECVPQGETMSYGTVIA